MALSSVLAAFRQDPAFMRCVTAWERIPARPARVALWPTDLNPQLVAAVARAVLGQVWYECLAHLCFLLT